MVAAVLGELTGVASSIVGNLLTVIPQGQFVPANGSPIIIPVTLEETSTDLVVVTDHPVEAGVMISDHAYYRPAELVMRCGWSNSSFGNLENAVTAAFSSGDISQFAGLSGLSNLFGSGPPLPVSSGGMTVSDYVSGIYSQLLAMQQSLLPFTVLTSIRQYTNMMLTSLAVTRDKTTSQALMVTATMRQVIFVNTVSTTLAAIQNMANPASTAQTVQQGQGALLPNATPNMQGGALPAANWPDLVNNPLGL